MTIRAGDMMRLQPVRRVEESPPTVTPGVPEVDFGAPEPTARTPTVATPEPIIGLPAATVARRVVIRQEAMAQDGLTRGETAAYDALWRLAEKRGVAVSYGRRLRVGYSDIAKESRQSINTVKANLRSLHLKLAITASDQHLQSGTEYVIYGYREILQRRRAAGLTHYIKMNGAVSYVGPATGTVIDLETLGVPSVGVPEVPFGLPIVGGPGIPTVDSSGVPTVDDHLYRKKVFTETERKWARDVLADKYTPESEREKARAVLGDASQ